MDTSNTVEEDPRKVLKQQGEEIKAKSEELVSFAADAAKKATEYLEIANITIRAAEHGFELGDWETPIGNAFRLNEGISGLLIAKDQYYRVMPLTNSTGTAVVSGLSNLVSSQYYPHMPPAQVVEAQQVNVTIAKLFERHQYRQRARDLMARFGLTGTMRRKFDAAWEAFLQAPQGMDISISALIPLRSSINLIVNELIRRRPTRRPVNKKEKILEIGDQLHDNSVGPDVFIDLNEEHRKVNDLLSGAKDAVFERSHQEELMRRGTMFIVSLLEALDSGKLR